MDKYCYEEEYATILRMVQALQNPKYPAWINDKIKRDAKLLWDVRTRMKKNSKNDDADNKLREIFRRWDLEFGGKDNWIAYGIGDALVRFAGMEPVVKYEDERPSIESAVTSVITQVKRGANKEWVFDRLHRDWGYNLNELRTAYDKQIDNDAKQEEL